MLFELQNAAAERVSHCGVLEFIAEEGMIYMPYWVGGRVLFHCLFLTLDGHHLMIVLCCPEDDGESIVTRRRLRASEKCNCSKGYIR